MSHTPVFTS